MDVAHKGSEIETFGAAPPFTAALHLPRPKGEPSTEKERDSSDMRQDPAYDMDCKWQLFFTRRGNRQRTGGREIERR